MFGLLHWRLLAWGVVMLSAITTFSETPPTGNGPAEKKLGTSSSFPYTWYFRLESIKLSSEEIREIRGTLQNLSDQAVKIDRIATIRCFSMRTRIWNREIEGYYVMRQKEGFHLHWGIDAIVMQPGDTLPLVWESGYDPSKKVASACEFVLIRRPNSFRDAPRAKLIPGEYVIDSEIALEMWASKGRGFVTKLGTVDLSTSNKLWVSFPAQNEIGENVGQENDKKTGQVQFLDGNKKKRGRE